MSTCSCIVGTLGFVLMGAVSGTSGPSTTVAASQPVDHVALIKETMARIAVSAPYGSYMEALKNIVTEDDLPLLHETLRGGTSRVRRTSAWLLNHIGSTESIEPLRAALRSDRDGLVRLESALALGRMNARAAEADLIQAMRSDSSRDVRFHAAGALNMIGTATALRAIRATIKTEKDGGVRAYFEFLVKNSKFSRHLKAPLKPGEVTEGFHKGTRYLVYFPKDRASHRPLRWLVLVHGTCSWPDDYVRRIKNDAEENDVILLGIHFDCSQHKYSGSFNLRRNQPRPDLRLLGIIDELSRRPGVDARRVLLYGHSEGAQFVHRFALAHPDRTERAAVSSCGGFVLDDPTRPFGVGTAPSAQAPDLGRLDFGKLVQVPLAVVNGTAEDLYHLTCAEDFMNAVRACAAIRGIKSQVRFFPVEGGGHDGFNNWPAARRFLFCDNPAAAGGYEFGPITLKKAQTNPAP